jgi:DNA-binding PucR family transcriptional regulator
VHVNTIANRLRRVAQLTGHDIRNPSDAVGFSLALRARELLADG